jgi:hypothetical protein
MRENMTTIPKIGRGAGQRNKPTEGEGCEKSRYRAESQQEGGVEAPGKVTTNRTRGVQRKVEA